MDWATIGQAVLSGGLQAAGSYLSADAAKDASKKAYKRAKEFAQSGIQWKVADANAAGINPYFALGAPTATYSDSSVGVDPVGSALESMGQNVDRAALANMRPNDKAGLLADAQLANIQAQTELTKAKTASEMRLATQAGTPIGYQAPFDVHGTAGGSFVSQPNKNQALQPHYGEGADMLTAPDLVYDLGRQRGNIFDPRNVSQARAAISEGRSAIARGLSTLEQWYSPGGWNQYWR